MPSKATAGCELVAGGGGDGDARAVEDRTGPAHPRPEDVGAGSGATVRPHHQVVGAVEGHRRCELVVRSAVEMGMPEPSRTAPARLTRAP